MTTSTTNDTDLFSLPESEVDQLPYGVITLDPHGNILTYNRFQSSLSHLRRERVIGRNFFRDVAPCTAVSSFLGRFETFASQSGDGAMNFDFTFNFAWGAQHVAIQFLRSSRAPGQIKMLVNTITKTANAGAA